MSDAVKKGHAAWVWVDLDGQGERWQLAVPVDRDDPDGGGDYPALCQFDALFPLQEEYICEVDDLLGCPERLVPYPQTPPTQGEIAAARQAAEDDAP
jgi:hypothetical protein